MAWEHTLQLLMGLVILCGLTIMLITRLLSSDETTKTNTLHKSTKQPITFKESIYEICHSPALFYIATMVVGFALTTNLIDVIWKQCVKSIYPSARDYNAYMNQLTTAIGTLSMLMALFSGWLFKRFTWSAIALITPTAIFITSLLFFFFMQIPAEMLSLFPLFIDVNPIYLAMIMGSIYYVVVLTAKYSVFDVTKEIAFLSIESEKRMRAKGIIDSVGSRLGKSGACCLVQILLTLFGTTAGHLPLVTIIVLLVIGLTISNTNKLGLLLRKRPTFRPFEAGNSP